jgi:hypothetical protein
MPREFRLLSATVRGLRQSRDLGVGAFQEIVEVGAIGVGELDVMGRTGPDKVSASKRRRGWFASSVPGD